MEAKYGVLELLLVSAKGIKHGHHLGSQRHYVIVQCGDHSHISKITQGKHKKIWWNEKFRFSLSLNECKELAKVTLKIMERDKFSEDSLVGETRVHVGDIIREGSEREFLQVKPAPYNIVLEDGTYKGELKLGLNFFTNMKLECSEPQSRVCRQCDVPPRQPSALYKPFLNITLPSIPWRRFVSFCTRSGNGKRSKRICSEALE